MKLYFATIFDINYLSRGLLLLKTLKQYHADFTLFIVCLDENVKTYFLENHHKEVELITLREIEEAYPELLKVKETRKKVDYIFTLSPFYPSYILKKNPNIPFICSLDADQVFFGNAESVFSDLNSYSVLITPHRFPERLKNAEIYGKYNVSFQVFKNNEIGNACLALWRSQCFEWCKDELEDGKFADQKYLDNWHEHFGTEIHAIDDIGVGLAPWNLEGKQIRLQNGRLMVDNTLLILFHYQGLRFFSKNVIDSGLNAYGVIPDSVFKTNILKKIINELSILQQGQQDTINRNGLSLSTRNILKKINGYSFFYRIGERIISLDKIFGIKKAFSSLWRK